MKTAFRLSFFSFALVCSQQLQAAGFSIIEHSASGLGQAFAGAAAVAEDTSTIFFNPAGMTYLNGSQVSAGLHLIKPSFKFADNASNASLAGSVPVNLGRDAGTDAGGFNFVPNFYYKTQINPQLHLGFGVTAPVGLNTKYEDSWMGRYASTESDLKSIDINPAIAFKMNEQLSIGAGISIQYLEATLENKTYLCGHPQLTPSCNPTSAAEVLATDGHSKMQGDSWSAGFNLGVIYQPQKSTRIGLAYRSQVKHGLEGDLNVVAANGYPLLQSNIRADLDLPETLSLSLLHQVNSKLTVLGDITYTGWDSFQELKIVFPNGSSDITEERWDNSMRYSLGLQYRLDPQLLFRTGVAYDNTPISDLYRTARIPGDNRTWLSFGVSYHIASNIKLDLAYAYLWVDSASINEKFDGLNGAMQGTLAGTYESSVDIMSMQLSYQY